jgi:hypothetical protein
MSEAIASARDDGLLRACSGGGSVSSASQKNRVEIAKRVACPGVKSKKIR